MSCVMATASLVSVAASVDYNGCVLHSVFWLLQQYPRFIHKLKTFFHENHICMAIAKTSQ